MWQHSKGVLGVREWGHGVVREVGGVGWRGEDGIEGGGAGRRCSDILSHGCVQV